MENLRNVLNDDGEHTLQLGLPEDNWKKLVNNKAKGLEPYEIIVQTKDRTELALSTEFILLEN